MHVSLALGLIVSILLTAAGCGDQAPAQSTAALLRTNEAGQADSSASPAASLGFDVEGGPRDSQFEALLAAENTALQTVERVEIERYFGKWYEIARYDNLFQSGLVGVTAEYRPRDDGRIDVINTGRVKTLTGRERRSTAVAWVVEPETNAKLAVQFVPLITADYWIIDLAEDYSYAVVGQPSRAHLWILCRAPNMDEELYQEICRKLRSQGYDPSRLKRTPQPVIAPAD